MKQIWDVDELAEQWRLEFQETQLLKTKPARHHLAFVAQLVGVLDVDFTVIHAMLKPSFEEEEVHDRHTGSLSSLSERTGCKAGKDCGWQTALSLLESGLLPQLFCAQSSLPGASTGDQGEN